MAEPTCVGSKNNSCVGKEGKADGKRGSSEMEKKGKHFR